MSSPPTHHSLIMSAPPTHQYIQHHYHFTHLHHSVLHTESYTHIFATQEATLHIYQYIIHYTQYTHNHSLPYSYRTLLYTCIIYAVYSYSCTSIFISHMFLCICHTSSFTFDLRSLFLLVSSLLSFVSLLAFYIILYN